MPRGMSGIHFGTDGWRAIIGDQFTFDNVRKVSDAIGAAARSFEAPPDVDRNSLAIGYDRRFLSREFAEAAAESLKQSGYRVLLSDSPTPTQTISFTARQRKLLGGVVITASHNPAAYNGIKFKGSYGGSGLPQMYSAIAENLGRQDRRPGGSVEKANLLDDYVHALRSHVDAGTIRSSGMRILHDAMHGVAASIPSRVFGVDYVGSYGLREDEETTAGPITTIRGNFNPGFGGVNPEPIPENLAASMDVMRSGDFALAICNDGDADRLGVLDEKGEFVSPHKVLSLLSLYLVRTRGERGEIVKTFSTTRLIERIAKGLGVRLHETAIGFKYVADLMLTRNILIGGEESGGIGFGSFLPERDGILSGLVVAECVAKAKKPLSTIVGEMEEEFGALHFDRRDLHRPVENCERLIRRVKSGELDGVFGSDADGREEKDGIKLNYGDGSWILFRKSGTEPLIRIYAESPKPSRVKEMLEAATRELDSSQ
jgi:phosphomannomutase